MTDGEKAADRATKLLRSAAPSSGGTEAERSTAALLAAELIHEHGLVIKEPIKAERDEKRRQKRKDPVRASSLTVDGFNDLRRDIWVVCKTWIPPAGSSWKRDSPLEDTKCSSCGGVIAPGDEAWRDASSNWLHYERDCAR